MRNSGNVSCRGAAILALMSVLVVTMLAMPVSAQVPDYGKLFGTTGPDSAASQPQQSFPVAIPGAGAGPSVADYARVAAAAPEPMLGAAQKASACFANGWSGR